MWTDKRAANRLEVRQLHHAFTIDTNTPQALRRIGHHGTVRAVTTNTSQPRFRRLLYQERLREPCARKTLISPVNTREDLVGASRFDHLSGQTVEQLPKLGVERPSGIIELLQHLLVRAFGIAGEIDNETLGTSIAISGHSIVLIFFQR